MGNCLTKRETLDALADSLYSTAESIDDGNKDFIQLGKISEMDVTGGISTGSSSSKTYTSGNDAAAVAVAVAVAVVAAAAMVVTTSFAVTIAVVVVATTAVLTGRVSTESYYTPGNDKIKIWYEIDFVKILRGRTTLLTKWVAKLNSKKENNNKVATNSGFKFSSKKQKKAFMKRREVTDNNLTLDDLFQIYKIPHDVPRLERGKYMLKKLKELLALHGFRGNKDILNSLFNLIYLPEGRCTSGFRTFLDALSPHQQKIISDCDDDKNLSIKLSLSYTDPKHVELYENAQDELKQKIKSEILIPIELKIDNSMIAGEVIDIEYKWKTSEQTIKSEVFEWTIPDGFLSKYKIGQEIDFPEDEIPLETSFKIEDIWSRRYYSECRRIKDPPEIKKKYHLSFNIGEIKIFKKFIFEMMKDFITYKDRMISEGALEQYEF